MVRARYPVRGMLGITARRFARDVQEAVFEDFDSMRSPRNVSVRDTSIVQHMAEGTSTCPCAFKFLGGDNACDSEGCFS